MVVFATDEEGLGQQYHVNTEDYSVELVRPSLDRPSTVGESRRPRSRHNQPNSSEKHKLKKVSRPKSAVMRTNRGSTSKRSTLVPKRDVICASFSGRPASAHGVGARFLMERARLLSRGNLSRSKARPRLELKLEFDTKRDESGFRATHSNDIRANFEETMKGKEGGAGAKPSRLRNTY